MPYLPSKLSHLRKNSRLAAVIFLFALTCLFTGSLRASQQELILAASPPRPTLAMNFIDATHGWTINAEAKVGSVVLATDDGGKTWMKRGSLPGYYCNVLFFLNILKGWALARPTAVDNTYMDTFVMETHDGGKTWNKLAQVMDSKSQIQGSAMTDLRFADERHGWTIGQGMAAEPIFLETSDGGVSFSKVQIVLDFSQAPNRILSDRGKTILVIGHNLILASSDQGASWHMQASRQKNVNQYRDLGLWGGWLFRDGHWLAVGNGKGTLVVSTSDYGVNWTVATDQLATHLLFDVSFYDASHGCAVGNLPFLLCTSNGGATWTNGSVLPAPKPTGKGPFKPGMYMRIILLPGGMGWVITEGGYLYQTTDSGQTWEDLDLTTASAAAALFPLASQPPPPTVLMPPKKPPIPAGPPPAPFLPGGDCIVGNLFFPPGCYN